MTKESTGKVLEGILNDADAAAQVAAGDFTTFAEDDLTDAERALLQAAANDLDDDVAGFAAYIKFDGVDGEARSAGYLKLGDIAGESLRTLPNLAFAINYTKF